MLAEILKSRFLIMVAASVPVAFIIFIAVGGRERFSTPWGSSNSSIEPVGSDAMGKMKESLARNRTRLADYEKEQSTLRAEVIRRRKLFQDGQISKEQVLEVEQSFVAALKRLHEMRSTVTETDIAITEAVLGEKVLRLPVLPIGGFSQTAELTRFNGP